MAQVLRYFHQEPDKATTQNVLLTTTLNQMNSSISSNTSAILNKLNTIPGKSVSSNDFTDYYKDKLKGIEEGAEVNVLADWNESDSTADSYIQNKPSIDTVVTQNSDNLITSGAVFTAIDNLPEPMIFKGSLGVNGTILTLPSPASNNIGFTYKVITDGTYAGQTAKAGDVFISDGTNWIYVPSADEPSGTVTNIAMTVPTGLEVSGSPISTSGTFAITYAVGYAIPTLTDQATWTAKQDAISDLSTIRSRADEGHTAYNSLNDYLPLTGGIIAGSHGVVYLYIKSTTEAGEDTSSYIGFLKYDGSPIGYIGCKDNVPKFYDVTDHVIWHDGNDGSGSGLDADKVDGYHASSFALSGHTHSASDVGALKNYGNDSSRPNGTSFTMPGGSNIVQMRSGATSGSDIGIFHLSDDNAFICNSSDDNYTFAVFDTDRTTDFSNVNNAEFCVTSNGGGCTILGHTVWHHGNDGAGSGLDADLLDGQHGSYYAAASSLSSYLPLSGGTMTGAINITGYNSKTFSIKKSQVTHAGDNIDIGWDWSNRHGAGAYFRSSDAGNGEYGEFGFYARDSSNNCDFIGKPDGTLTWGGKEIATRAWVTGGFTFSGSGGIKFSKYGNAQFTVDNTTSKWSVYAYDGTAIFTVKANKNAGVGTENPSYKLHVAGDVGATAFTNTSDIRNKDFVSDLTMDIEQIANAPSFKFRWKTGEDKDIKAGSSAQYWNMVLPETVTAAQDLQRTLSMQYDVVALLSSITIAKEVVSLKEEIKLLQALIAELKLLLNN